jgi:hypothetical protein
MKRALCSVSFFLILLGVLLFPSCATLTRSRSQKVPVTSNPVGATVIVNGAQKWVTPLELRLPRNKKGQVIRIESEGYNPVEIRLQRKMPGGTYISNFLFGFVTGAVVTFAWAEARREAIGEEGIDEVPGLIPFWILSSLAFGTIFTVFDGSGSGYSLNPGDLAVTLTKADGMPRVDTIFIDAEDFQNIKWIRVRRE